MMNWTKICRACKEIKVAVEFSKRSDTTDGLQHVCDSCLDLKPLKSRNKR